MTEISVGVLKSLIFGDRLARITPLNPRLESINIQVVLTLGECAIVLHVLILPTQVLVISNKILIIAILSFYRRLSQLDSSRLRLLWADVDAVAFNFFDRFSINTLLLYKELICLLRLR